MPLSVDYSEDWQWVDGVETLSITPKDPASSPIDSVQGVRTSVLESGSPLGADYGPSPESVTFYVWAATLGGYVPNQGDIVTDESSISWVVDSTSLRSDAAQRRLLCVRTT